jgi:hypothetical protein
MSQMESLGVTPKSDGHCRRKLEPATAAIAYTRPLIAAALAVLRFVAK